MQNKRLTKKIQMLTEKDSAKNLLASLLSILIGITVGALLVLLIALFDKDISLSNGLEAVKLIFFGIFSKGRADSGEILFGFSGVNIGNMLFRAMPIIMTGLSVSFAFKSGLFNIGAPGQYLIGTAASLITALSIPSDVISPTVIWLLA